MSKKRNPFPYVFQLYPRFKYGVDGARVIVQDAAEGRRSGPGWYDSPVSVPLGSIPAATPTVPTST